MNGIVFEMISTDLTRVGSDGLTPTIVKNYRLNMMCTGACGCILAFGIIGRNADNEKWISTIYNENAESTLHQEFDTFFLAVAWSKDAMIQLLSCIPLTNQSAIIPIPESIDNPIDNPNTTTQTQTKED